MREIPESGLIIFDGSCGVCSTFIGKNRKFFERYKFSVALLQEPWVKEITGLPEEELLKAIHLFTKDGEVLKGIDFIERLASKVWWMLPMYWLMKIKFFKDCFGFLYMGFAKNRQAISKVCGLTPKK